MAAIIRNIRIKRGLASQLDTSDLADGELGYTKDDNKLYIGKDGTPSLLNIKGEIGKPGPEGKEGKQGEKGEDGKDGADGKDGTGVNILGSYNTFAELQTAHPTGNVGDAYLIDGDLYVWSDNNQSWDNVGNIKGPKGDDATVTAGTGINVANGVVSIKDSGVSAGTYTKVKVNAQGQITQGLNPTTFEDYNISNQTFLDKLKSVDGAGSGLDADLIRGYEPWYAGNPVQKVYATPISIGANSQNVEVLRIHCGRYAISGILNISYSITGIVSGSAYLLTGRVDSNNLHISLLAKHGIDRAVVSAQIINYVNHTDYDIAVYVSNSNANSYGLCATFMGLAGNV